MCAEFRPEQFVLGAVYAYIYFTRIFLERSPDGATAGPRRILDMLCHASLVLGLGMVSWVRDRGWRECLQSDLFVSSDGTYN